MCASNRSVRLWRVTPRNFPAPLAAKRSSRTASTSAGRVGVLPRTASIAARRFDTADVDDGSCCERRTSLLEWIFGVRVCASGTS